VVCPAEDERKVACLHRYWDLIVLRPERALPPDAGLPIVAGEGPHGGAVNGVVDVRGEAVFDWGVVLARCVDVSEDILKLELHEIVAGRVHISHLQVRLEDVVNPVQYAAGL
jgi:hypothetical protein